MKCKLLLLGIVMICMLFGGRVLPAAAEPSVIGAIRIGWGGYDPVAVAVNSTTNLIYTANRDNSTVSVIDGGTDTVVAMATVGSNPEGVVVNSATNRIYTTNHGNNSVSVIDGGTNTVVGTIPVGFRPQGVAVNPVTNHIYTANEGSSSVSVIDGSTNTVVTTIPLGSSPRTVAVDPTTNQMMQPATGVAMVQLSTVVQTRWWRRLRWAPNPWEWRSTLRTTTSTRPTSTAAASR